MRKYLCPILVIALAVAIAGAWAAFPNQRKAVGPAVSSFCKSFAAEARNAWTRLFPPNEATEASDAALPDGGDFSAAPRTTQANHMLAIPTALGAIADPANDPEPDSLTREQRKLKYDELVAAAGRRKREVLLAGLKKCPEGMEALKATRAYHAKVEELKKLEERQGKTDDGVATLRIELVRLKETVKVSNARYKAWKDAHPGETIDPMADKLYCDLIARSRFYED